jgi:hypothetical protein
VTWDRSINTIANAHCTICGGRGLRDACQPCGCVLRAIFRACYARFQQQATGPFRRPSTYVADFVLVGQRALADSPLELAIFKAHFLLAGDWKICCRQMKIDRGPFFHAVYRISEKLGRVYAELQPYPLYPTRQYFAPKHGHTGPCQVPAPARRDSGPVRPPLAPRQPQARPAPALVPVASVANVEPVIIDPKAFARARFADGATTRSIAAALTGQGIPAPNSASRWGIQAVRRILLDKAA